MQVGQGNRVENMWADMREICLGEAEELVGRTSGYGVSRGEKWWWNGEVQESIKRKSKAFKDWKVRHAQGAEEWYREEERDVIRRVGMAIGRAAEQLNERLGTREGEKDIYKISNLRKRQRQDLGIGCHQEQRWKYPVLYRDEDNKERWREYFEQLLNTENEREEMG
ncbi:uncharacterized protein [Macrobrachium rosenbergii]|uniref:uncharacterized protein n=1 Tax=Macrobrachium rosenbergii TaxID=79674 RepID=UPI0034D74D00